MTSDMQKAIARLGKPTNVAWLCDLDIEELPPIPRHVSKLFIERCHNLQNIDLSSYKQITDFTISYGSCLKSLRLSNRVELVQVWECPIFDYIDYPINSKFTYMVFVGVPKLRYLPPIQATQYMIRLVGTGLSVMPKPLTGSYGMGSFDIHDNLLLPDFSTVSPPSKRDLTTSKFWEEFWNSIYRMKEMKEEIVAAAWHPRRVSKWLEAGVALEDM